MALRITGSVIGEPITPTTVSATGMWTSQEVAALQYDQIWPAVTYSLTASASNVYEGSVVTATLTTTGIANGAVIPYVITGANIFANDFTIGNITGNFVIQNGSNTISFTANADLIVEGTETFTITAGTVSANIIINDEQTPVDPYFANTVLLLHGNATNNSQNNTFLDSSANVLTITRNGNSTQGTFSPYGSNWSTYFSGSDSIHTPASSITTLVGTAGLNTSSVITIECWVFHTLRSLSAIIIGDGVVGGPANLNWSFGINSSGKPEVYWWTGGENQATCTNVVPLNTWTHLAVVINAGNIKIFINGVQETLTTSTFTNPSDGTNGYLIMGKWYTGGTSYGHYGYVSNLRIVKSALYSATFNPGTAPLTAIANTSLLVFQNNRIKDNSTNNFTLTSTGTPTVQRFSPFSQGASYSTSTIGGSAYFDGTGDYLQLASNESFNPSTGPFTFELWVYPLATTDSAGIFTAVTFASDSRYVIQYYSTTGFGIARGSGWIAYTSVVPTINSWSHLAISRDTSNNFRIFLNGVAQTLNGGAGTTINDSGGFLATAMKIGHWSNYFNGYMSDIRLTKGTAVYTGNFTPPTAPLLTSGSSSIYSSTANVNTTFSSSNTSLLMKFNNAGVIDNAMMNNLETIGDVKISTTQSKFGGSSMFFDGTGDYLFSPGSVQFQNYNFGTSDFTIECWLYQIAFSADMVIVASFSTWASSVNFYFGTRAGSPNILIFRGGDSIPITLNGNTGITTNTWTHVAVSRASGVTRMFVGGVVQTATHTGSVNISNTVNTMGIGAANDGTESMNGYLDDFRITKGYARYTATFTPPTGEFENY